MVFLDIHVLNKPEIMISNVAEKIKDGKVVDQSTKEHIHDLMEALIKWTRQLEK
jgi:chromate reductase